MQEYDNYIYRAPFVVSGEGEVIADGAVITEHGRVLAVGPYAELKDAVADAEPVDYEGHVIVPALVNAHCHLELSHLAALGRGHGAGDEAGGLSCRPPGDLPEWIRALLAARDLRGAFDPDEARFALARLYAGGCRAVLDIGNQPEAREIGAGFKSLVLFHLELLGLSEAGENAAIARLAELPDELCCTAHAPYSTGPRLLTALKERSRRLGGLFPLHVAESSAEVEFLAGGGGPFRDFLAERGVGPEAFATPGVSPVRYLDRLGLLDEKTICVHAVQVEEADIALLAARRAGVCLCPGSNRRLGVGRAPLPDYLAHGIVPALGTDSLASNQALSLWSEMAILRQDHPQVGPEVIFAMATSAGADLLGLGHELGRIAPGVSASLPAVVCPVATAAEVLEYLTTAGEEIRLEWIE